LIDFYDMVTPTATPRRAGDPDDRATLPMTANFTTVRRNPMDTSGVAHYDHSALAGMSMLRDSLMDSSVVSAAAALPLPRERSVMPLPTRLLKAGVHNASAQLLGHGMVSIAGMPPGASDTSFRDMTFAAEQRLSPTRGRFRPTSRNSSRGRHNNTSVNASSKLGGFHVPDASCCGYQRAAEHATRSTSSKVFVTYCEQSLMSQVDAAKQALESEQDARAGDTHVHKVEMIRMLRSLNAAETERDDLKRRLEHLTAEHDKHTRESSIIRDEFERRLKIATDERNADAKELDELRKFRMHTTIATDARNVELETAERRIAELKASLGLSEKGSADNSRRAQQYFEELTIARKNIEALERENTQLREMLSARESIIRGMEKELANANEKLASISVMRSSFKAKR
jgi:hypothetical protein